MLLFSDCDGFSSFSRQLRKRVRPWAEAGNARTETTSDILQRVDAETRVKWGVQTPEEAARDQASAKQASFSAFDLNGDGVVDVEEVRQGLMERFGVSATSEEIRDAMDFFDVNEDGVLQMEEFAIGRLKMEIVKRQDTAQRKPPGRTADKPSRDDRGDGGGPGPGGGMGYRGPQPAWVPVPVWVDDR